MLGCNQVRNFSCFTFINAQKFESLYSKSLYVFCIVSFACKVVQIPGSRSAWQINLVQCFVLFGSSLRSVLNVSILAPRFLRCLLIFLDNLCTPVIM